jgi:ActR/RegA family two-component response regulator
MKKKRVFLIEDDKKKRDGLWRALTDRHFETFAVGTVTEALSVAESQWESFDVMIADMLLENDPVEPQTTGAHIGIKLRRERGVSPECIILTNYPKVEFYKLAIELGASAFLDKISFSTKDIVRYVRTLALRNSLSIERPQTIRQILRIVTQSYDRLHAIKMFCQKVFSQELASCLGAPFLLILTAGDKSEYCAGDAKFPKESNEFYGILHTVAKPEINKTEPSPLNLKSLAKETGISIPDIYNNLNDAVLLPIFASSEHKISITLVIQKECAINLSNYKSDEEVIAPGKLVEDPIELWKVLNQYLKPTVVEHLLTIFSEWNHIKTTLREISQICIWIGQEQTAILRNSSSLDDSIVKNLRAMANDLTESGNLLRHIEKPLDETVEYPSLSAKEILEEVWEDIKLAEELDDNFIFEIDKIESDCNLESQENDLYVVFSRLLQWFVKRPFPTSPDTKPTIKIQCQSKGNESIIIFTDKSNRLDEKIRKELFAPFTQSIAIPFKNLSGKEDEKQVPGQYLPLYIAKMIVEVKYGGELIDCSNELDGTLGHKLVLRFIKEPQEI